MCAHHRLSHSFPTRRSSDLAPTADDFVRRAGGYGSASPSPSGPPQPAPSGRRCSPSTRTLDEMKTADRHELVDRSEEHTSELQSLRHLVCRLLLEKKKQPYPERHDVARAAANSMLAIPHARSHQRHRPHATIKKSATADSRWNTAHVGTVTAHNDD